MREVGRQMTTGQMNEAARLWGKGWTLDRISEAIGVSRGTIAGLTRRRRDLFPARKHHADEWMELLEKVEGMSAVQAGIELGVSADTIWDWRKRLG